MSAVRATLACGVGLAICLGLAGQARAGGTIPVDTLKEIKAATVFVKVNFAFKGKIFPGSGSGFVMLVKGDTGFIATNDHVINPPKELPGVTRSGPISLVFHSGTPNEKTVTAEIVATDPSRDLAVLKVTGFKDLPKAIPSDPKLELLETMSVFAFGFPFGQALSLTKGNPAITVGRGAISSIRNDEFGQLKVVQIDGDLNPGNSGGPVVDEKGRLVGIAVAKLEGTRIGMAIPPQELAKMLLGRVGGISLTTLNIEKEVAEIRVRVNLIDPLLQMKGVSILYRPTSEVKQAIKLSKDGKFPAMQGATKVELKIDGDKGEGTFRLPAKDTKGRLPITFQTVYVKADGEIVHTAAIQHVVDFSMKIIQGVINDNDPRENNKPYKVHKIALEEGKLYTIELEGDAKVIDPYLIIKDAAGKVLAQDDDSGGYPNARIVFRAPRSEEYQIVATVFKGAGPYVLVIRDGAAGGQEIPPQGLEIIAQLTPQDPSDTSLKGSPRKVYSVQLKAGQAYLIDLKSRDFDAYLRIEDATGKELARDDDSGGNLDSRIRFVPPADGLYHIIATCLNRRPGNFVLTVRRQ